MITLFMGLWPSVQRDLALASLTEGALYYNAFHYVAYHCAIFHRSIQGALPTDQQHDCTLIDFVPFLREAGNAVLHRHVEEQIARCTLQSYLAGLRTLSGPFEEPIFRETKDRLDLVCRSWHVLPPFFF